MTNCNTQKIGIYYREDLESCASTYHSAFPETVNRSSALGAKYHK